MIELKIAKNVYGRRVAAGAKLTPGKDIPGWQAKVFLETGVAVEWEEPPAKKSKKKIDTASTSEG